jgi:geranylgeranyl pyrophosphate synthase
VRREPLRLIPPVELRFLLAGFRRLLPAAPGRQEHLQAVLEDVLSHPGSLARAQLVHGILRAHGFEPRRARALAVAVESFHTASLIFDDLPSMDDAQARRGRPCPHRVWGEGAATLAALALVNRGYALVWSTLSPLPKKRRDRAAALIEECLGADGILDGQARDLHFSPGFSRTSRGGAEEVLAVAAGKTVPLVRLALVLPAVVAGERRAIVERLERLASAWGLAYQALDDCKDHLMRREETGKSMAQDAGLGRPNLPARAGWDSALARLDALLAKARGITLELVADRTDWSPVARLQSTLEAEVEAIHRRRDDTPARADL